MTATNASQRYTPENAMVVLVDHQSGTIDWVYSLPKATVIASCRTLARMAVDYQMPLLLTTTMEEFVGPTIPDLQDVAKDAFAKRFKRGGQLSCFDDASLREAAKATGRKNMILAGLTTVATGDVGAHFQRNHRTPGARALVRGRSSAPPTHRRGRVRQDARGVPDGRSSPVRAANAMRGA